MRLLKTSLLTSQWGDDLRMNIAREAVRAIGDTTPDRIAGTVSNAKNYSIFVVR